MKTKQLCFGFFSGAAMLALILDSKTALVGASEGVMLCLMTVIPSLFPFFVLSVLLTSSLMGTTLAFLRPLGILCALPKGGESLLAASFLGGYPAGAQAVAESYRAGQLPKQEAERLLAFCNQAGPAFLFGMMSAMFPRPWMTWALWGIQVFSAVLVAQIFPGDRTLTLPSHPGKGASLSAALWSALRAMAAVCGWVVIFRVLLAFCGRWFLWLLPVDVQTALTGLLELSNGCIALGAVTNIRTRFCIAAGILACGGLCVSMQTLSVTTGLSHRRYFQGKALQTVFALALALTVTWGFWLPLALLFLIFALFRQKRGSIPKIIGV